MVIMTLFVAFVVGLGYIFSRALGITWILPLAIIFASVQAISSYWWSDKVALAISGAKQIQKSDAPELYRLVENLSITAGLPTPQIYIISDFFELPYVKPILCSLTMDGLNVSQLNLLQHTHFSHHEP